MNPEEGTLKTKSSSPLFEDQSGSLVKLSFLYLSPYKPDANSVILCGIINSRSYSGICFRMEIPVDGSYLYHNNVDIVQFEHDLFVNRIRTLNPNTAI